MKASLLGAVAAMSLAGVAETSRAALSYAWASDTPASGWILAPGASQSVHLYLQESGATPTAGIAAEQGLLGVGFAVSTTSPGQIIGFAPDTNTFSEIGTSSFSASTAQFSGQISFSAPGGPIPDANGLISLGTVTVSSRGPGLSTFLIGDISRGTQTGTVLDGGSLNSLDGLIAPGSFTVAVPEPASLGMIGLAGLVLIRRRGN